MKIVLSLLIFACSLLFFSCEEDFDPKSQFKEKYGLNAIICVDSNYHVATLSHTYSVDGYDPFVNTIDPVVLNADIRIWQKDDVLKYRDSVVSRSDTNRYKTPNHFYYLHDFSPIAGELLEIKAELNNGKILTGQTKIPYDIKTDYSHSDLVFPSDTNASSTVQWETRNQNNYYIGRFEIFYRKKEGTSIISKVFNAGMMYKGEFPVYHVLTKANKFAILNSDLDKNMLKLSEGDNNKKNYIILGGNLEIIVLDYNLSVYYASTHNNMDGFSINLDETDYSSINGGFGIFGAYIKRNIRVGFKTDYIKKFGYEILTP